MRPTNQAAPMRHREGFTLIELMIALVISTALLAGVFQLVFIQNEVYARQQGIADARQSLRAAGTLLAWELRHVDAAGGDVYAIGPDSVSVRSYDGSAVVCRKRVNQSQYGLHSVSGDIETGDSAMIYLVSSSRTQDDAWHALHIAIANTPSGLGMSTTCPEWPGTPQAELGIQVSFASSADTAGIRIGAPVRAFHRRTYRMIQENDDWWLAVREGAGSYRLLTGPLRAGDGLQLRYFDAAGAATTVAANVSAVEFTLHSESPLQRTVQDTPADSIVMRVQLRG